MPNERLVRVVQVTMVDRSAADRICKDPNPIIDGRKANVNLAYLGAKPRTQATELLGIVTDFTAYSYSKIVTLHYHPQNAVVLFSGHLFVRMYVCLYHRFV